MGSLSYLDLVAARTVVFDGAMGTQIQALDLTAEDYGGERQLGNIDHLSLTRPDAIEQIHLGYLDAGADVVETNSFQASPIRMEEWGVGDATHEINLRAAQIARRGGRLVRDSFAGALRGRRRSAPPACSLERRSGALRHHLRQLSEAFRLQARGLIEGGADLLMIETQQDILETRAAIDGCRAAFARRWTRRSAAGAGRARRHRPDAAGDRHRGRAGDPACDACGRDRRQLLGRPGAPAGAGPLPVPSTRRCRSR